MSERASRLAQMRNENGGVSRGRHETAKTKAMLEEKARRNRRANSGAIVSNVRPYDERKAAAPKQHPGPDLSDLSISNSNAGDDSDAGLLGGLKTAMRKYEEQVSAFAEEEREYEEALRAVRQRKGKAEQELASSREAYHAALLGQS